MAKNTRPVANHEFPYTPNDWTPEQLAAHRADTLDDAFHAASCLSGGWYRRAVSIDYRIVGEDMGPAKEEYMLRPSEVPVLDGWTPSCEVKRLD